MRFILGLVIGIAVGAAVGLIIAPQSGKVAREALATRMHGAAEEAEKVAPAG